MISFLHITQDDKFFDVIESCFETDKRLTNDSIVIVKEYNYKPKYIKEEANVSFIHVNDIKSFFASHCYNVVFCHSLDPSTWKAIKYIPKETTIIWWAWGWDLYDEIFGMKPLIDINLYKPITSEIEKKYHSYNVIKRILKKYVQALSHIRSRYKAICRVDYFQPVIFEDYKQVCKHSYFRAKLFYYKNSISGDTSDYILRLSQSSIIVGNSATSSNNHLDILNKLESIGIRDRQVVVPFNYGSQWYIDSIKDNIETCGLNVNLIKDFLPREEYFKLMDSCGFALYGVIRQQSMGNIYQCLRTGIKLFLYKDSLVYKYLKDFGYVVFSIDDMTKEDLETPLTKEEHEINCRLMKKESSDRNAIYEKIIKELEQKYHD